MSERNRYAKSRFLIVDDFLTMRRIIRTLLKDNGYIYVEEAEDGAAALQKLKQANYDFVIADLNMPNTDGLGLLTAIRADARTANLPVLIIAAEANKDHIVAAAKGRANGYIVKPFTGAILTDKIVQILDRVNKKSG
jgi:two-component system chemotaxis response regulator CheY